MVARGFGFWMWRQTLARVVLHLLSAEYSNNVRGLAGNLSDLTVASSQYAILLCSETFVSDMCHVSELLVPRFCRPAHVLLCRARCLELDRWLHMYEMVMEHFANPNLSVVVAKLWFLGFVV